MVSAFAEIRGSYRDRPPGRRRRTAATKRIEVQVYLRAGALPPISAGETPPRLTRENLVKLREVELARPLRSVERFARKHRLEVVAKEPARRMLRLAGPVSALEAAFGTTLHDYRDGEHRFRARTGSLRVPKALARIVEAVLGFSTRRLVVPALGMLEPATAQGGRLPTAAGVLYEFPVTAKQGGGQRIALVQAGGVYYPTDTRDAFAAMNLAVPTIIQVPIPGVNQPPDIGMDRELALDVQMAGAAAPGATLLLYVAADGLGGVVDAIGAAVHDQVHDPTIISISFGAVESAWGDDIIKTLAGVLNDAANLGMTVIAASGDSLATGGYPGTSQVSYPSSDLHVLSCGGTMLSQDGGILREAVWNDGQGSGSGGGISVRSDVPPYQQGIPLPADAVTGKRGRGIPDVAAIADQATSFAIRCRGAWITANGTSAGAPLWAGLIALINAEIGSDIGFIHSRLYQAPGVFNDVTLGDNRDGGIGYTAAQGWDACTGLGSPRGKALLNLFAVGEPA